MLEHRPKMYDKRQTTTTAITGFLAWKRHIQNSISQLLHISAEKIKQKKY